MTDTRRRDINWLIEAQPDGLVTIDQARLAVLMDLRDELQKLNRLLGCHNFVSIPNILRTISRNTAKPARKASGKKTKRPEAN